MFFVEYWYQNQDVIFLLDVSQVILMWWKYVENVKVFSILYFYVVMGVSDYYV